MVNISQFLAKGFSSRRLGVCRLYTVNNSRTAHKTQQTSCPCHFTYTAGLSTRSMMSFTGQKLTTYTFLWKSKEVTGTVRFLVLTVVLLKTLVFSMSTGDHFPELRRSDVPSQHWELHSQQYSIISQNT